MIISSPSGWVRFGGHLLWSRCLPSISSTPSPLLAWFSSPATGCGVPIPLLARLNIPAPVVGGLLVAIAMTIAHRTGTQLCASTRRFRPRSRTRSSRPSVLARASSCCGSAGRSCCASSSLRPLSPCCRTWSGAATAAALGQAPLLGVLAGSVTLTGGPATGLAFAPLFEQAGVQGAATVAVAAAMAGIVCGGLIGAPLATYLIERGRVAVPNRVATLWRTCPEPSRADRPPASTPRRASSSRRSPNRPPARRRAKTRKPMCSSSTWC